MTTSHPITLRRIGQVQADTGLSRSAVYRLLKLGEFPEPVKLSDSPGAAAIAWASNEIDAWIAARIAGRDAVRAAKAASKAAAERAPDAAAEQQGGAP